MKVTSFSKWYSQEYEPKSLSEVFLVNHYDLPSGFYFIIFNDFILEPF